MKTNGKKENVNKHRRGNLERVDEIRHRQNRFYSETERGNEKSASSIHGKTRLAHRKSQEAVLHPYIYVRNLPIVSKEWVEAFHELFFDAIKWYEQTQIPSEEKMESENSKYSLLTDLRGKVEKKEEFSDRDRELVRLLEAILSEYRKHLVDLKKKPWSRKETVDMRLDDMERLVRGNVLRIKLD